MTTLGRRFALWTPSSVPAQQPISRKQLHTLVATAQSPDDFARLEVYFRDEANRTIQASRAEAAVAKVSSRPKPT